MLSSDMMLQIRTAFALCDIEPGKELLTDYLGKLLPHSVRQRKIQESWDFICKCTLCKLKASDNHLARQILMEQEWQAVKEEDNRGSMILLQKKVMQTYAPVRVIKPDLAAVCIAIAARPSSSMREVSEVSCS